MSMLRKSAVTVAIAGAGLASLSGAAFANTSHHGSSHDSHAGSCTNNVKALNKSDGGALADVAGGAQTIIPVNVCNILNDNKVLNHNTLSIGGTATEIPGLPTSGGIPGFSGIPSFPGIPSF